MTYIHVIKSTMLIKRNSKVLINSNVRKLLLNNTKYFNHVLLFKILCN